MKKTNSISKKKMILKILSAKEFNKVAWKHVPLSLFESVGLKKVEVETEGNQFRTISHANIEGIDRSLKNS